jgi:hypothetical protein
MVYPKLYEIIIYFIITTGLKEKLLKVYAGIPRSCKQPLISDHLLVEFTCN